MPFIFHFIPDFAFFFIKFGYFIVWNTANGRTLRISSCWTLAWLSMKYKLLGEDRDRDGGVWRAKYTRGVYVKYRILTCAPAAKLSHVLAVYTRSGWSTGFTREQQEVGCWFFYTLTPAHSGVSIVTHDSGGGLNKPWRKSIVTAASWLAGRLVILDHGGCCSINALSLSS